jgi:tripartite ATP-independent transporter DctP family solute receptor
MIARRSFTRGGLAVLVLAGSASPSLARAFRAADTQSGDYPTVQALIRFDQLVRERTGGRHSVTVFHSRQLGEEKETIEQTRVGAIDLNRTNVAPLADVVPELNVLSLPFLFRSQGHLHRALEGQIGDDVLGRLEAYGLVGLAFLDSGARSIYNAERPIRRLDDLRGLRIRVQQSELMIAMIRALGAVPVALPYGQVATALSTRIIDGAENNWPSYVSTDHYRTARHITLTEHTMSPELIVMSARAWATLSREDREIFRASAREAALYMRDLWQAWEHQAQRDAVAAGCAVVSDFDRASFESAVAPVIDRLLESPALRGLADAIRAVR